STSWPPTWGSIPPTSGCGTSSRRRSCRGPSARSCRTRPPARTTAAITRQRAAGRSRRVTTRAARRPTAGPWPASGGGSAAAAAAAALKSQLVALAAKRAGLDEAALECRGGDVYRRDGVGERPVLTLATSAPVEAVGKFTTTALTYTYGAHVAHVAVDPETGATDVLRLVTVEDVGRAINPALVHGQAL